MYFNLCSIFCFYSGIVAIATESRPIRDDSILLFKIIYLISYRLSFYRVIFLLITKSGLPLSVADMVRFTNTGSPVAIIGI